MNFRGTRAELTAKLREIPAVLAGREPDPLGLADVFFACLGNRILSLIHDDYVVKSFGGVGLDGVRWKDLAPATLERRRRKGVTTDIILIERGELHAALIPPGSDAPDAPRPAGQVFEAGNGRLAVGVEGVKADAHQYGTGRIPARPITPDDIPAGWEWEIDRALEDALLKVVERICAAG